MNIRGLELPTLEFPTRTREALQAYLACCPEDSCIEILHSGLAEPNLVSEEREALEILAGMDALRDPEHSPDLALSAISFAYLLYHYHWLTEAFQTLTCISQYLSENGLATADWPLVPSEDPFWVGALFLSHGRWHGGEEDLPEARAWLVRSWKREEGIQHRGVILAALALIEHRLRRHEEAHDLYGSAIRQLRMDIALDEEDGDPIFSKYLAQQIEICQEQARLCEKLSKPAAVLTRYGFLDREGRAYEFWTPVK